MRAFIVILVVLSACAKEPLERVRSQEPAKVLQVIYQAGQHGSGDSVGITSAGDFTYASTDVDIEPKWAVVFQCQHGKFVVEGSEGEHKALWKKLTDGQEVIVTYDELYRTREGQRQFVGYDFLDAEPAR